VNAGQILLGNTDIRRFRLRSLRTAIALVPQDPVLFDGTLRENILLGKPDAGEEELEEIVQSTQLRPVVAKLSRGLDEYVGPHGAMLSGGEKQRVALAQALLRRPQILILDESTSALDGPTEAAILSMLDLHFRTRILIVISHRPSVMQWADRILLVDQQTVAAIGTHRYLYETNALYRKIFTEQLEHEDTLDLPLARVQEAFS
jgi:ABC-type multidrug transport system fused ATPase/permease subunit